MTHQEGLTVHQHALIPHRDSSVSGVLTKLQYRGQTATPETLNYQSSTIAFW